MSFFNWKNVITPGMEFGYDLANKYDPWSPSKMRSKSTNPPVVKKLGTKPTMNINNIYDQMVSNAANRKLLSSSLFNNSPLSRYGNLGG